MLLGSSCPCPRLILKERGRYNDDDDDDDDDLSLIIFILRFPLEISSISLHVFYLCPKLTPHLAIYHNVLSKPRPAHIPQPQFFQHCSANNLHPPLLCLLTSHIASLNTFHNLSSSHKSTQNFGLWTFTPKIALFAAQFPQLHSSDLFLAPATFTPVLFQAPAFFLELFHT